MSHPDQMKMILVQIEMIQFDAASTDSILFSQVKIRSFEVDDQFRLRWLKI